MALAFGHANWKHSKLIEKTYIVQCQPSNADQSKLITYARKLALSVMVRMPTIRGRFFDLRSPFEREMLKK